MARSFKTGESHTAPPLQRQTNMYNLPKLKQNESRNYYKRGGAHELSAWLAHRFIKDFKVTHKKMKDVEDSVTYIGFPATSLEKYTPENATVEIIGEKSIDMFLSKEMIPDEMSKENFKKVTPIM